MEQGCIVSAFHTMVFAHRLTLLAALLWFSLHLPFIMSFVLSASALAILVRAHDSPDSPVDSLYETFVPRSEEHVSAGLRWFYCGGMGIALLCMAILAHTHVHKTIPNQRLFKNKRLFIRILASVAILCLPIAHLDSLDMVGTVTGLLLFVLVIELFGASCAGENVLWDTECKRNRAQYEARCAVRREELEKAGREGQVVDVEEIAGRDKEEKGVIGAV